LCGKGPPSPQIKRPPLLVERYRYTIERLRSSVENALLFSGKATLLLLENPAFYVVDNEVFFAGQRLVPDIKKIG
jgi:hypothetical protein